MWHEVLSIKAFFLLLIGQTAFSVQYDPTWESLDSRPIPPWYDEAKIGIFLHWGVFSVPSYGSAWFWKYLQDRSKMYVDFMKENYRPGFTYQDFGPLFKAEFYDPEQWADIFNASGANYVVLTSKHHEGFTLWPSQVSWNWNSMDIGPKRDLVGDLAKAVRSKHPHIHFGLYHSLFEWYNPLYLEDKENSYQTNKFVEEKTMPELMELVNAYTPDIIWSDGDWEAPDWYWNSTIFLAWLFNDSPIKDNVVVNDRWGKGIPCHHGSYYTCHDRYNPGTIQSHKWENALTLDKFRWGHRRNMVAGDVLTMEQLLAQMAKTISCGGNFLINAGPTADGMIPPLFEERLRQMGEWLSLNGEAIYSSKPWHTANDSLTHGVWFTSKGSSTYAILTNWPATSSLILGSVQSTSQTAIRMLSDAKQETLNFVDESDGLHVSLPTMSRVCSKWAWVLKMENVNLRTVTDHRFILYTLYQEMVQKRREKEGALDYMEKIKLSK